MTQTHHGSVATKTELNTEAPLASAMSTQHFRLTDLPTELRLKIYHAYTKLHFPGTLMPPDLAAPTKMLRSNSVVRFVHPASRGAAALLLVSRAINQEASPIVQGYLQILCRNKPDRNDHTFMNESGYMKDAELAIKAAIARNSPAKFRDVSIVLQHRPLLRDGNLRVSFNWAFQGLREVFKPTTCRINSLEVIFEVEADNNTYAWGTSRHVVAHGLNYFRRELFRWILIHLAHCTILASKPFVLKLSGLYDERVVLFLEAYLSRIKVIGGPRYCQFYDLGNDEELGKIGDGEKLPDWIMKGQPQGLERLVYKESEDGHDYRIWFL